MMISPEMYVAKFENATYNEMINERDGLIRYILHFEKMEKAGDRSGDDLTTGWIKKERAVQQVLIEGTVSIKKGMSIEHDRKITIQYHSFKGR